MSGPVLYLDTSAFLKLLVAEQHSTALRRALTGAELWSSSLLDVEAHRAAPRLGVEHPAVAAALEVISLVTPTDTTYAAARSIAPDELGTLDALHLACAQELGADLEAVVTYDQRLADGCRAIGLPSLQPR